MSAGDLGKKLLAEVDEVGLDEILSGLRIKNNVDEKYFGVPKLDGLIHSMSDIMGSTNTRNQSGRIPIVELLSLRSGGGKTHLLYYLTAVAVLPTHLQGRQTAVVILDADNRFSTQRLIQQLNTFATPYFDAKSSRLSLKDTIKDSLKHVHIFRPTSLASTIATLKSLQAFLFDANRHYSFDRAIGFIALDSASTFYWEHRADVERSALLASTSEEMGMPQTTDYAQLAAMLRDCSKTFNSPVILTTRQIGSLKKPSAFGGIDMRSVRSSLPVPWQTLPSLRLLVQRVPIRKFPAEISFEEVLREDEMRQKVMVKGQFDCFVNEWGLDEKTRNQLHRGGFGFEFSITGSGVRIPDTPDNGYVVRA